MGDNRNFAALDWVVGEIGETLKLARQSLEAYVENPQDTARMQFCLTHIHQVHGSLQMVEFYGAALMAEEMESLALALLNHSVNNESEAQEVLMRAILQLPVYLDQVKISRKDQPAKALPLLNDLRAVRGENLLTESNLFSPDLAQARRVQGERLPTSKDNKQFQALMLKLRKMYQVAASGIIRGNKLDENIAYLQKVFARLRQLTQGTARQPLWDIALALLEGLANDAIEPSASVKNLLRQLDAEIKLLARHGVKVLESFSNEELIKNLLYYVAQARGAGEHLQRVQKVYNLTEALNDVSADQTNGENTLGGPDQEALRSVAVALKDELESVKQALELCLNHQDTGSTLADTLPVMKRVADTMAVLGLGVLRKQLLAQSTLVEQAVVAGSGLSDDNLMSLARQFIEIENGLDDLARSGTQPRAIELRTDRDVHIDQAQASVLRECRNGLEQAKDAINEYIASQWDISHLGKVPTLLREIRGGLDMIPLARPARILGACARYIEEQLLEARLTPEWSTLDRLADAITSVEYYLERFKGDREEDDKLLLGVAEESMAVLGYAVASSSATETAAASVDDSAASESVSVEPEELTDVQPAIDDEPQAQDADLTAVAAENPAALNELAALEADSGEPEPEVEHKETTLAGDGEHRTDQTVVETDTEAAPVGEEDDEELIDEEILEIFIDEAEEVTENISEFFPRWANDFDDIEALGEFRRAFHTLKGSGRMVQAHDIGELAWSVENMLNRLIDGSVAPDQAQVQLIELVRALIPLLIEAFRNGKPNPEPELCRQYQTWGEALASGTIPDELSATASDANEVETSVANSALPADNVTEAGVAEAGVTEAGVTEAGVTEAGVTEAGAAEVGSTEVGSTEVGATEAGAILPVIEAEAGSELPLPEVEGPPEVAAAVLDEDSDDEQDSLLWEIFGSEAIGHLQTIEAYITEMDEARPLYSPPSDSMQRALHTLKGSAHMADVTAIAELATPLERFVKELRTYQVNIDDDILQLIKDGVEYTLTALTQIEAGEPVSIPKLNLFIARVAELKERSVAPLIREQEAEDTGIRKVDPELLAIFMAEEMNLLLDADQTLAAWHAQPQALALLQPLQAELQTLEKGAEHANLPPMAELSGQLRTLYEALQAEQLTCSDSLCETLLQGHNALLDMVDSLAAGQNLPMTPEPVADRLSAWLESVASQPADIREPVPGIESGSGNRLALDLDEVGLDIDEAEFDALVAREEQAVEAEKLSAAPMVEGEDEQVPSKAVTVVEDSAAVNDVPDESVVAADSAQATEDDIDAEILEIFVDEADELLEEIEQTIHDWEEDWSRRDSAEELKRALHTLKGGARLAGLMDLGELAHEFETELMNLGEGSEIEPTLFEQLNQYQDRLLNRIEALKGRITETGIEESGAGLGFDSEDTAPSTSGEMTEPVGEAAVASEVLPNEPVLEPAPSKEEVTPAPTADILPFTARSSVHSDSEAGSASTPASAGPELTPASTQAAAAIAARRSGPQEVVKVSAELLEDLVNLAGETSISRSRMEEQISEQSFTLEEMESTINRLQEQLRRLDIETEAQVLFRQEQLADQEEFDPLEMDRYSQLQQLARSLTESASDLMDLKTTLADKNRDTETLLLQQSRINTDLQEGLMRSRMVPFSRLVPRLRRIVRQVSGELGKQVNFELNDVEGELDRSVLERMVAPLEHMLRNAVDHGIEDQDERRRAGKPETGTIALSLGREGGDVLLRMQDDGRGINLERVREKAIERGLMSADAQLADRDVMQFILQAGFSTADQVTQISGRGVGMDVVHSEIKQLGGSMYISSAWGEGTEFVVRLPFTVSVNRALMVVIGEDQYAIPLNTIEGIVRVSPFELEHYYQDPSAHFEYAGESYSVRYLGQMLNSDARPKLEGQALPLPVVLVRSAENAVALQVDSLMGSREIVVKTLGPQFSTVQGLSGATVMGDGSVVVILDPHAMIRKEMALLSQNSNVISLTPSAAVDEIEEQTVMVVDDSVTVRKVTSRFLEREGFNVVTAKDGADAMRQLQDSVPDLMLLDIEMPRMDGFEVAKNIRSSSRLKALPIIMITSRTGAKHRDRALALGVNKYMGKPYQEEQLLSNIRELIGDKVE